MARQTLVKNFSARLDRLTASGVRHVCRSTLRLTTGRYGTSPRQPCTRDPDPAVVPIHSCFVAKLLRRVASPLVPRGLASRPDVTRGPRGRVPEAGLWRSRLESTWNRDRTTAAKRRQCLSGGLLCRKHHGGIPTRRDLSVVQKNARQECLAHHF